MTDESRQRTTDELSHFLDGFALAVQSHRTPPQATGTEGRVCALIAARQRMGLNKYGMSVADNPLSLRQWLVHQQEELADALVYCTRALEELDRLGDDGK